jgi:hypothetical protein
LSRKKKKQTWSWSSLAGDAMVGCFVGGWMDFHDCDSTEGWLKIKTSAAIWKTYTFLSLKRKLLWLLTKIFPLPSSLTIQIWQIFQCNLVGWWCDGIELRTTCPVFHLLRNVVVRRSLLDMVWDLTWLWQICFVVVLRVFCFAGSGWPWWFSWWLWCCGEVLLLLLTVARIVAIHPTYGHGSLLTLKKFITMPQIVCAV